MGKLQKRKKHRYEKIKRRKNKMYLFKGSKIELEEMTKKEYEFIVMEKPLKKTNESITDAYEYFEYEAKKIGADASVYFTEIISTQAGYHGRTYPQCMLSGQLVKLKKQE